MGYSEKVRAWLDKHGVSRSWAPFIWDVPPWEGRDKRAHRTTLLMHDVALPGYRMSTEMRVQVKDFLRYARRHEPKENPSGGATAALAIGGVLVGALGAWLAYPYAMAHMTPRTNTLGLPAPGQSASSGSFRLSTSSDGSTLTITDNSTQGAGAQTNIPIASLSGNLNAGTLAMANAPSVLTNINNAFQGQGDQNSAATNTSDVASLSNPLGLEGPPKHRAQINPQLG